MTDNKQSNPISLYYCTISLVEILSIGVTVNYKFRYRQSSHLKIDGISKLNTAQEHSAYSDYVTDWLKS